MLESMIMHPSGPEVITFVLDEVNRMDKKRIFHPRHETYYLYTTNGKLILKN